MIQLMPMRITHMNMVDMLILNGKVLGYLVVEVVEVGHQGALEEGVCVLCV